MGDNVIYVHKYPWGLNINEPWWDLIKRPVISDNDYQSVLTRSTKAASVCMVVAQNKQIKYKKNVASDIEIMAVTPEFENIRSFEIESGRYFSSEEAASQLSGPSLRKNYSKKKMLLANRLQFRVREQTLSECSRRKGKEESVTTEWTRRQWSH